MKSLVVGGFILFYSTKKGVNMIKNNLKDFNYDLREYNRYASKKYVEDVNGIIRRKWSLYLHNLLIKCNSKENSDYPLSLKRKH